MTRDATDPIGHDALARRLVDDLRPVHRLWSPWVRLALWLALALGTVAFAAGVGLRTDLAVALSRPRYVLDVGILLAGAGLAATIALLVALPGRMGRRPVGLLSTGVLVLAIAAAWLGDPPSPVPVTAFVTTGLRCTACVGLFGLVPWQALFWAVGRAAPFDGRAAGLCVGAAAFLVGTAAVRLACPIDDVFHLAVWHGLPATGWALASSVIGRGRLGRWMEVAGEM